MIKRMSFSGEVSPPLGWVHYEVHVGPNGCYTGASRIFLKEKPTLFQFRSEDYQNLGSLPQVDFREVCRQIGAYSKCTCRISCERFEQFQYPEAPADCFDQLIGNSEDVIEFMNCTIEDYTPYFHQSNIQELEARWRSISRDATYLETIQGAPVAAGIDIHGRVDSLVIFPDDKMTLYQVCVQGGPVFVQHIVHPVSHTKLPIVLLTFKDGQIDYAELCTLRGEPDWLRTVCPVPPVYV